LVPTAHRGHECARIQQAWRALFNAAAIDASDVFHCFQVVCHELAHSVEEEHNGRFVAAIDECERAHFPAFWGHYVNHVINCDSESGTNGSGSVASNVI
jgi:hypothetical protein